jgi:hypothetical protein
MTHWIAKTKSIVALFACPPDSSALFDLDVLFQRAPQSHAFNRCVNRIRNAPKVNGNKKLKRFEKIEVRTTKFELCKFSSLTGKGRNHYFVLLSSAVTNPSFNPKP